MQFKIQEKPRNETERELQKVTSANCMLSTSTVVVPSFVPSFVRRLVLYTLSEFLSKLSTERERRNVRGTVGKTDRGMEEEEEEGSKIVLSRSFPSKYIKNKY